jgi:hypothetical protein
MTAGAILVDSRYYIGLLREGRDPLRALEWGAATRDLAVCGLIRCEVTLKRASQWLRTAS